MPRNDNQRVITAARLAAIFTTDLFAHNLRRLERSARSILRRNKCAAASPEHDINAGAFIGDYYIPDAAHDDARTAANLLFEISFLKETAKPAMAMQSCLKIGAMAERVGVADIIESRRAYLKNQRDKSRKATEKLKGKASERRKKICLEAKRLTELHGGLRFVQKKNFYRMVADASGCKIRTVQLALKKHTAKKSGAKP